MADKDFWHDWEDIKEAVAAYHKKDYDKCLELIFGNDPNEEIYIAASGEVADDKLEVLWDRLNQKYPAALPTLALKNFPSDQEIPQSDIDKWWAHDFSFITDKETRFSYDLAKEAFDAGRSDKDLALVTQMQTTYHSSKKSACEQIFKEYEIEAEQPERAR